MYVYVEQGIAHFINGDSANKIDTPFKLKSCPKCDTADQLNLHRKPDHIYCKSCGIAGPSFEEHPDDAIEEWNLYIGK